MLADVRDGDCSLSSSSMSESLLLCGGIGGAVLSALFGFSGLVIFFVDLISNTNIS